MLPAHVGIVPLRSAREYGTGAEAFEQNLLHVSAALQTQVTRDFAPLWGTPAVVSPFKSLEEVPVGYLPVVIVPEGTLRADGRAGFRGAGHQPVAIVEHVEGWSVLASHQLLELLADPTGGRTVFAPPTRPSGTDVEYLVAICDPCQQSTYTIDGVLVSDFVMPEYYYGASETSGGRFCFTGRLPSPRTLLQGGYISWCAPHEESARYVFQLFAPQGEEVVPSVADLAGAQLAEIGDLPTFSRDLVDSATYPPRPTVEQMLDRAGPLQPAERSYDLAGEAARRQGEDWRARIETYLDTPPRSKKALYVVDAATYKLLEDLATNTEVWHEFKSDPRQVLERYGIHVPPDWPPEPFSPLPMSRYAAILEVTEVSDSGQPPFRPHDMGYIHM